MILKSYLLGKLNSKLQREETDIDEIIESVLLDLTVRLPALRETISFNTEADTASYDVSTYDIRNIEAVTVDGELLPGSARISHEKYLERLGNETGSGEPLEWCYYEGRIYLTATPDGVYAIQVFTAKWSMDADSIDLPDYFKPGLVNGCCAEYLDDMGLGGTPDGIRYSNRFEKDVARISGMRTKLNTTGELAYGDGL